MCLFYGRKPWFLHLLPASSEPPPHPPFPLSQQGFVSNQPTGKNVRPDLTRGKGTEAPLAAGMRGRVFLLRVGFLGARALLPKERASPSFPVCASHLPTLMIHPEPLFPKGRTRGLPGVGEVAVPVSLEWDPLFPAGAQTGCGDKGRASLR